MGTASPIQKVEGIPIQSFVLKQSFDKAREDGSFNLASVTALQYKIADLGYEVTGSQVRSWLFDTPLGRPCGTLTGLAITIWHEGYRLSLFFPDSDEGIRVLIEHESQLVRVGDVLTRCADCLDAVMEQTRNG